VADLDQLADLIDPPSIFVAAAVPVDDIATIRRDGNDRNLARVSRYQSSGRGHGHFAVVYPTRGHSPACIEVTGRERIYASAAPVEVVVTIRYVPDAIVISAYALFQDDGNNTFYVFLAGSDGRAKS
jgi:hypothetical protein